MGVKFIFIISLMHTLSDKVRFVQRKLKPEEAFRTKKWMVLAEHLLAQAHIYIIYYNLYISYTFIQVPNHSDPSLSELTDFVGTRLY